MKKRIVFQLIGNFLAGKPALKKKLLIFSVVAFSGMLVAGVFVVSLVFQFAQVATQKTAQMTTEVLQNEKVTDPVRTLWAQAQNLRPVHFLVCWEKAQAIGVTGWIVTPVSQNLQALKLACLPDSGGSSDPCRGSKCSPDSTYI